jgi:hypothetical protein
VSTGFLIEPTPNVVVITADDTNAPVPIITSDVTPVLLEGTHTKLVTSAEGPKGQAGEQGIPGPPGLDGETGIEDATVNGGNF